MIIWRWNLDLYALARASVVSVFIYLVLIFPPHDHEAMFL